MRRAPRFVMPTSQALALAQADFARGAGSALLGAAQFFSGALTSPVVGAWGERTAIPMAAVLLIAGILAFACAVIAVRAARAAE